MKKEEAMKKQNGLFEEFVKQLKDGEADFQLNPASENGVMDMAMVHHENMGIDGDSVLGCYYFMPQINEETEILQFVSAITITDETPADRKEYMLQAVLFVNYFLPHGSFIYDEDLEILTFKSTTTLLTDFTDEQAIKLIAVDMTMALYMVSLYVAPLLKYMNDEMSWEDFAGTCKLIASTPVEQ